MPDLSLSVTAPVLSSVGAPKPTAEIIASAAPPLRPELALNVAGQQALQWLCQPFAGDAEPIVKA